MIQNIAIHGVPRSGTTWVGAIFDSSPNVSYYHQPLFSYAFKSYLSEKSSSEDIEKFFKELSESNDNFVLQKDTKDKGSIPVFKKSNIMHVAYKEARYHNIVENMLAKDLNLKIVGLVRNPKSVISSWYKAPKEFKANEWDLLKEWRNAELKNEGRPEEFYGYEKWKEVAKLFLTLKEKYPDRFYLLEYKKLLENTAKEVNSLFDFCGIEFGTQTKKFIEQGQQKDLSNDPYSVFRSNQTDDKWKKDLPKEIANEIDKDLKGTELERFNF